MRKPLMLTGAILSLALGITSVVRSHTARETTLPPKPPPSRTFEHSVAAVGLVETSTENISIGSPMADVVAEVLVVVGQSVKVGDPLFRLDDRQWRADLGATEAEFEVARSQENVEAARLADVARDLSFVERIADSRAVSEEEVAHRRSAVETAKANLQAARARVQAAHAQIGVVRTRIERSLIKAPVEGQILQVKVHPGEFAPAGVTSTPLILLGRLQPLYVRVDVDEHEAWRVRSEAKAVASVRGNADRKVSLTFVRFEPFVLPKKSLTGDSTERVDTRVLQMIYRIEEDDPRLFVGQQMDVFIDADQAATARSRQTSGMALEVSKT